MIFQLTALIHLGIFYGCYFGKMIAQKRKGIQTDQIGKGKTGVDRRIELTMKAATLSVPALELISICMNTVGLPRWARYTGIILAISGDMAFVISVWTMRDSWRAGVSKTDQTELVTDGIYQISRNPAFLGFDLVYVGILLMFFNWLLFAFSIFAMFMFHLQIVKVEEVFLSNVFGSDYEDYKKKVNRYLGRKYNGKGNENHEISSRYEK